MVDFHTTLSKTTIDNHANNPTNLFWPVSLYGQSTCRIQSLHKGKPFVSLNILSAMFELSLSKISDNFPIESILISRGADRLYSCWARNWNGTEVFIEWIQIINGFHWTAGYIEIIGLYKTSQFDEGRPRVIDSKNISMSEFNCCVDSIVPFLCHC